MADTPAPFTRFAYPTLGSSVPILTRGPGVVQIGFDQEPTLLLTDVPSGLATALALLDGCHSRHEIVSVSSRLGVPPELLHWALRTIDEAGLLAEGRGHREAGRSEDKIAQIRLVGAGRLGRAVADLLTGNGPVFLRVIDNEPPDLTLYPGAGALGSQAAALSAALGERDGTGVRVANHWSKPEDVVPDLTVVATDRLECDRVLADDLVRADQPHLFVRARVGGVVVGPLVLPGRTACLRCTDLTRRDADPAWPVLLPQLVRRRVPVPAALVGWAGGVAAAQTRAFLAGVQPESWGATIEISATDYLSRRRSWAMHAGCGCGWGATAQWEA